MSNILIYEDTQDGTTSSKLDTDQLAGSRTLVRKSEDSGLYLVRYQTANVGQETDASRRQLLEVNRELGLSWIRSYESDDGSQTFSVYEAPNADILLEHATRLGIPADSEKSGQGIQS